MAFQEEESLIIDIPTILSTLRQKGKIILAITLIVTSVVAAIAYLPFQKKYRSEAMLLFNPGTTANVIANVDPGNSFLQGQSRRVDPFKNQEELLKSRQVAVRVHKALMDAEINLPVRHPEKLMDKVLNAQHVRETDFIKVSAIASNPVTAQKIAKIYVDTYLEFMEEILYTPLQKQEELFSAQVKEAEENLKILNSEIEAFQKQNGITNIDSESELKISQQETLARSIKETEALMAERKAEAGQIQRQLNIKPQDMGKVIQAVAGGQDGVLAGLQNRLYEAVKEYEIKALTYSPTNPDMRKLEEQINVIKRQIADQQIITVGHNPDSGSFLIKDELRAEMVNRLVTRDAQYKALENKLRILKNQLTGLKSELEGIPEQQLRYAHMKLEQKNKETVLTKLQDTLAEIKIQKSALQKNLIEVDPPNLPKEPDTPFGTRAVILAALATLLVSSTVVVTSSMFKNQRLTLDIAENLLKLPVLAVVPWLPESQWQQLRLRNTLEVTSPSISPAVLDAYQNLALNLKVQRDLHGKNALVAASVRKTADKPFLLSNLAYCLAQSGERVVVIDTNLRQPSLHTVFGHSLNYDKGLTELINTLSEHLYKKERLNSDDVMAMAESSLLPSGIHPQLNYINAGVALNNTFEFLNSKGLTVLVNALKERFDWVFFDAPPFLQSPDGAVLLGYLDGLLLFAEREAEESSLRQVVRRVNQLNSGISGVVLRENSETTAL